MYQRQLWHLKPLTNRSFTAAQNTARPSAPVSNFPVLSDHSRHGDRQSISQNQPRYRQPESLIVHWYPSLPPQPYLVNTGSIDRKSPSLSGLRPRERTTTHNLSNQSTEQFGAFLLLQRSIHIPFKFLLLRPACCQEPPNTIWTLFSDIWLDLESWKSVMVWFIASAAWWYLSPKNGIEAVFWVAKGLANF